MTQEDYVSFEIAKLLKKKGFNERICHYYDDEKFLHCNTHLYFCNSLGLDDYISAPTLQMAMKWLREKHLLHISIDMMNGGRWKYEIDDISIPFDGGVLPKYYCEKTFSSYEEGINDAIKYCLAHLI